MWFTHLFNAHSNFDDFQNAPKTLSVKHCAYYIIIFGTALFSPSFFLLRRLFINTSFS